MDGRERGRNGGAPRDPGRRFDRDRLRGEPRARQGTSPGHCHGADHHSTGDNDYHYGIALQALVALRFIHGEQYAIDLTAREYYVTRVAGTGRGGHELFGATGT